MLPFPSSIDFPAALKAAREGRGMSRAALARAANIHEVMPRRYEEPDCNEFAKPRPETWLALNRALGFTPPTNDEAAYLEHVAQVEHITENGLFGSGPLVPPVPRDAPTEVVDNFDELLLKNASLEDIVKFLHSKHIEPTFRHVLP